ncbi:unnamed protein product [Rotaria sordida]|uniref:Tc1-like transposase DDE domain-containing protein n=1 Tax=Rotaria sordida TaxID=392033 RepID=A0A819H8D9_9BILA|nr:unnamed protein product [Rotaria sordida]CAF1021680.1 unnamed protein product [Rotaria sordida]CAF1041006.1 unnamed protein product [Rotaria sordida]CAF3893431.1 unnamed protein product [Rotaria sordida]CAF3955142.1 unnamed protein product [Rotaria sordida]
MDIEPDNDGGDSDYNGESRCSGFRPGAGRKRKTLSSSIQMMINEKRQRAARRQEISRYKAQLRQWISNMKWSHQGVPSTYCDNTTALLVIFNLMLENVDLTQTEAVAKADTKGGSLGNQSTELFMSLPHFIITTILDRRAEGRTTSVKDIQQAIVDIYNKQIGYWPMYYLMHDKMKLSYGLLKDSMKLTQDANRIKRIDQFLIKDDIIEHGITSDGLLHKIDSSTNKTISAELIYEAKNPFGDYQFNMDGYNFRLWVDQHLFLVFEAKYGYDRRMILVLDNALYHKEQEKLFEHKSLPVKPSVPDFHYFVLIPPYTPQLQTIEWIWSYVKGYVAKQFMPCRTVQQLIEQTRAGFYGDDGEHDGISTEMVRNMIAHAHKYCDLLIDDNPLLERSINNLKNVKNYEGAYEEEENEDEADDINIEIDDNIE